MTEFCLKMCMYIIYACLDEFPPCHPKQHSSFCTFYDGKIILTSEEKEEAKETKALEVDTDGNNDKNEKNDQEHVHKQENTGRDMCFVLCAAFICVNR